MTYQSALAAMRAAGGELTALHRDLVRIPTVNRADGSSAGETKLAEFAARYLAGAGIESKILEGAPGRGNLVAEAGGEAPTALWMSHSDVVPADPDQWTRPPFGAELIDGRIWGRGAIDCKMLLACQLFAMTHLHRARALAGRRIRLIAGADEEAGGHWGFGWLGREHPELLRADYAICEGGGSALGGVASDRPLIGLGVGEKGRYEVEIRIEGPGGHASRPWQTLNPLGAMAEIIRRMTEHTPDITPLSPIFGALGEMIGLKDPGDGAAVEAAIGRLEKDGASSLASSLRAQSRLTLAPTVMRGGEQANVIPAEAALICDARTLPGQSQADLERLTAEICAGIEGAEVAIHEINPASVTPWRPKMAAPFEQAASEALGREVEMIPYWCAGATDAHWVRACGAPVFGFQLISPEADPARLGIHCPDESIEEGMLLPCALALGAFH